QRSLLKSLDQTVQKFVAQQNKARRAAPVKGYGTQRDRDKSGNYTVEYPIFGLPEIGERKGFSDPTTLWLPFEALIPKSEEAPGYTGVLHLKLRDAADGPTATIQEAPIKEPGETGEAVSYDARFLDADQQLNETYSALRAKVSPTQRDALKEQQRAWINRRNEAAQLASGNAQETSLENPIAGADREVLKMTQHRTASSSNGWTNSNPTRSTIPLKRRPAITVPMPMLKRNSMMPPSKTYKRRSNWIRKMESTIATLVGISSSTASLVSRSPPR